MRNSRILKTFLVVSGLLLTFIGGATLFIPVDIKADSGIDIAGNINIINDTRAFGALVFTFAMLAFSGVFSKKLTFTASLTISLFFLSLGIGRSISLITDGMPVDELVKATILEYVLGLTGLILFKLYQEKQ